MMTEAELNAELWKLYTAGAQCSYIMVPPSFSPPTDNHPIRVPVVFEDKIRIAEEDLVRTDHHGRRHVKECLNRIAQLKAFKASYPYTIRLTPSHREDVTLFFIRAISGVRPDIFEWLDQRYSGDWARMKEFIGFKDQDAAFEFRMRWC